MMLWVRISALWLAWLFAASISALAQSDAGLIDYEAWENVAVRAEAAIADGKASSDAFESLRSEIVVWRDRFLSGQGVNSARLDTLRAQLEALGPAPDDGTQEATEIADRRAELNAQIAEAEAPVLTSEEAFNHADGLAREIDAIIRARQTDVLLRLGPTPLNPANWPDALQELGNSLGAVWAEFRNGLSSTVRREALRDRLPSVILLLLLGLIVLFRAPALADRAEIWALRRSQPRLQSLIDFSFSMLTVIIPVLGLIVLVQTATISGLSGFRTEAILQALPWAAFLFFGARWISQRIYVLLVRNETPEKGVDVLRRAGPYLGLLLALGVLLDALNDVQHFDEQTIAVVFFLPVVLVSVVLFRVGRTLTQIVRTAEERDAPIKQSKRSIRLLGRAVVLFAVVDVLLAAAGYMNAATYLVIATTLSLGLIAALILLDDVIRMAYAVLVDAPEGEVQGPLIPTLIAMALVIAALPLFALIWGARSADLTELWAQFREGVTLGDTRISPGSFLTFVVVFAALYIATRIVQGALRTNVLPKTRLDPGGQNAIVSGIGYVGIFLAALIAITSAGLDLSAFAIVFGALSVGIGFGLQNIVQNFVSGIILLIERPVAEGDWIEVGGITGTVRKISVRSTLIEAFDRYDVIVPNAEFISGAVKNWTRQDTVGRIKVPVGVAYGNDTRKVSEILRAIAMEHPLTAMTPEPAVDFLGFGADSVDFQIRVVLRDVNYSVSVRSEINHRIAERFVEEGIEIPFAQRDIWIRNPEALPGGAAVRGDGEPAFDSVQNDPPEDEVKA